MHSTRQFTSSPSHLNSSVTSPNQFSAFKNAVASTSAANASAFSLGMPRTNSPPPLESRSNAIDITPTSARLPLFTHSVSNSLSLPSLPPIRPLHYASLITKEAAHAELARTIADLTRSLAIVETGLTDILDGGHHNTIQEEIEDMMDGMTSDSESAAATEPAPLDIPAPALLRSKSPRFKPVFAVGEAQ